jgi:glycosyltransferase involved in cell wall biosynthesis
MPVTFLLPVKNAFFYVERSLGNVSSMASREDEIIVIDDGSSDGTTQILRRLQGTDIRFNFIFTKGIGLVEALNLGLMEAANEVIARVDVDDLYPLNRIHLQLPFLRDMTSAVFSDYEFFDSRAKSYGVIPTAVIPIATKISLLSSQRTAHPSVIFRKSAVLEAGGYKKSDFLAEDLGLWIRLSTFSEIATCPEVLLKYTLHGASVSSQNKEAMKQTTRSLLSTLLVRPEEWSDLQDNIVNIVEIYRSNSYGSARIQLLLRDLLIAYRLGERNKDLKSTIQYLSKTLITDFSGYPTIGRLLIERRKRSSLREGYSTQ